MVKKVKLSYKPPGTTLLHLAIRNSNIYMLKYILTDLDVDTGATDENGDSVLMAAVKKGNQ